jgi:RND family efflux transporter MFP subunit
MRWFLRIFLVCLVLAGATFAVLYQLRPVAKVQVVKRGTAVDAPSGPIRVTARMSPVEAEVDGRILRSALKLGAAVRAGDFLVEIDSSAVRIQIERLTSDLAAARRRQEIGSTSEQALETARHNLRIAESDFTRGSISSNDLEAVKRAVRSAEQTADLEKVRLAQEVTNFENELKLAQHRLERMTIFSGIDGTIVDVFTEVSDRVSPGTLLARISSLNRLVELQVSEQEVAKLKPGLVARVQFQPYPMERFNGVIDQILPPVEVNTQRYRVYLNVDIAPERLLHGMTGEGFVVIEEHENALLVPRVSLMNGQVFVADQGRVRLTPVEIGFVSIHEVEVLSGVSEGDLVVVDGIDDIRDGDRVKLEIKP